MVVLNLSTISLPSCTTLMWLILIVVFAIALFVYARRNKNIPTVNSVAGGVVAG